MSDRDPRIDPVPGDVIKRNKRTITIEKVVDGVVFGTSEHPDYCPIKIRSTLPRWRGRVRGTEILSAKE